MGGGGGRGSRRARFEAQLRVPHDGYTPVAARPGINIAVRLARIKRLAVLAACAEHVPAVAEASLHTSTCFEAVRNAADAKPVLARLLR